MSEIITLLDIARSMSLGPVKVDADICEIGDSLSVPDYWGFATEAFFLSYMGYGAVEIYFIAEENKVIVHYAHLTLSKFRGLSADFIKKPDGHRISFQLPTRKNRLTFDFIRNLFEEDGLAFDVHIDEADILERTATIKLDTMKFIFYGKKKILGIIMTSRNYPENPSADNAELL